MKFLISECDSKSSVYKRYDTWRLLVQPKHISVGFSKSKVVYYGIVKKQKDISNLIMTAIFIFAGLKIFILTS